MEDVRGPAASSPSPSRQQQATTTVATDQGARQQPSAAGALVVKKGGFKVPQAPRKATVLEEDDYVAALDHIITRDFFPDLPRLRLQEELHEAQRNDDHARLLRLRSQLHRMRTSTPGMSPHPATPSRAPTPSLGSSSSSSSSSAGASGDTGEGGEGAAEELTGVGLDGFLRGYTSEDNASFGELVEVANERKRERYAWLYGEEERVRLRIEARDDATKKLLLEAPTLASALSTTRPGASLDEAPYTVANALMYVPPGAPPSAQEEEEAAAKAPKAILHNNTRMPRHLRRPQPQQQQPSDQQQPAWTMLAPGEQELMEQRRHLREGLQSYDLDALRATPSHAPASPSVRGYGFVLTPSPAPHDSPFMTWYRSCLCREMISRDPNDRRLSC
jgi:protein DGCR14